MSVQNERVAGIADAVQRGFGDAAPTSKLRKWLGELFAKMSEQGPVYTACQFVIPLKRKLKINL